MRVRSVLSALVAGALFSSVANAEIVASNDFDAPVNLTGSTSAPIAFNGFTSPADAWGIYNRPDGGPFALFDDTKEGSGTNPDTGLPNDPFPTDRLGIVQSTKQDNFFGISDTVNGDTASTSGVMTGTWSFDISSAVNGVSSVDIDFAAMGDFESDDVFTFSYSIDGSDFVDIFSSSVDEDGVKDYIMEMPDPEVPVITLNDPLSINGTELGNSFETISADVTGTGDSFTLQLVAVSNGTEAFGFDNIVVNGVTAIPEPSSFLFLGCGLIGLASTRRRRNA